MKKIPFVLFSLGLLVACKGKMDYDISEGINREMTLFEDEITVPILLFFSPWVCWLPAKARWTASWGWLPTISRRLPTAA